MYRLNEDEPYSFGGERISQKIFNETPVIDRNIVRIVEGSTVRGSLLDKRETFMDETAVAENFDHDDYTEPQQQSGPSVIRSSASFIRPVLREDSPDFLIFEALRPGITNAYPPETLENSKFYSPFWEKITGLSREELLSMPYDDMIEYIIMQRPRRVSSPSFGTDFTYLIEEALSPDIANEYPLETLKNGKLYSPYWEKYAGLSREELLSMPYNDMVEYIAKKRDEGRMMIRDDTVSSNPTTVHEGFGCKKGSYIGSAIGSFIDSVMTAVIVTIFIIFLGYMIWISCFEDWRSPPEQSLNAENPE